MSASYELWLTSDDGTRLLLLKDAAYWSYSRVVNGTGTLQVGLPLRPFREQVWPVFVPDRRVEVWRSPALGYPLRLEGVYLLREPKIYTRSTDNLDMIEFFGNSPIDLLKRRWIIQASGTSYTAKTDQIDDMMKAIVREQMLYGSARAYDSTLDNGRAYPQKEFTVQADLALGPSISRRFADRNVLDVLQELKDTSFQMNETNSANRKIYFDVVPNVNIVAGADDPILDEAGNTILDEAGNAILGEASTTTTAHSGFQFQTFADLRGTDRRDKLIFSVPNSNLAEPSYTKSYFSEKNSIITKGQGRGESRAVVVVDDATRIAASRWNRCEDIYEASYEVDNADLDTAGTAQLKTGRPVEDLYAVFLNSPGSVSAPRSIYGLDWDMGDLVQVWFAEQLFDCEIVVVYVALDENGVETITGRNTVGGAML